MGNGGQNLTGKWDGVFSYPDVPEAGPTTPFLASLSDTGGVIKGEIIEPNEYHSGTAHSTVLGQRIGNSVHWAKTYHGGGEEYRETVLYFGSVSQDGDTITGEWSIDHWRGPFEMTRDDTADVRFKRETVAEVDAEIEV